MAVQNEEPQPVMIEEGTGKWLAQVEADTRRLETPQRVRQREQDQERCDLRRFLKRDERFAGITRTARRLPEGRRQRDLEDF
jgi:hypothetical protein